MNRGRIRGIPSSVHVVTTTTYGFCYTVKYFTAKDNRVQYAPAHARCNREREARSVDAKRGQAGCRVNEEEVLKNIRRSAFISSRREHPALREQ